MKTVKPTKKHARKIVELLSHGLVSGLGRPEPGQMCVEAAVCYALGLPHDDDPKCVGNAVRSAKIQLNDSGWSSNIARANGMQRIAVAQLGSNEIDQVAFAQTLAESTIKVIIPMALRSAASVCKDKHKEALLSAATKCEIEGSEGAARAASDAASYAASYAARAASYAASYAAGAAGAARDAARAASAASYAASAASYAAGAASDASDAVLIVMAKNIEQALIEHKSPGVKWLDICNPS